MVQWPPQAAGSRPADPYVQRHPVPETPAPVSANIVAVGDSDFETEVLAGDLPVLVDFWAEWCGPCKAFAPVLDELAGAYGGRLKVAKLDVDKNPQTPPKYGIRGIPTLLLFKDGELVGQQVGALSKPQLTAFLEEHL